MAGLDHMTHDLIGIGRAISETYLSVPPYQRTYAWAESNVRDLFQDISDAFSGKEKEYFLGSVVLSESGPRAAEIVDGQQRSATVSILIAAIRDYFYTQGDSARAEDIEHKFLLTRDARTQETKARVKLSNLDHDYYKKRVLLKPDEQDRKSVTASRDSHERIGAAAALAKSHVESLVSTTKSPADRLFDLLDYIEEGAKVIRLKVPDHANAFVVFETLNDRGLSLSAADLLKNFLFSLADDRIEEAQENWTLMLGVLDTVKSTSREDLVVKFVRHFWSSQHGPVRNRDLYAKIKEEVTSKQAAIDLSSSLAAHARLYAALLNPDHDFWKTYGPTARGHLSTIHLLRMEQNRPLLLAVLAELSKPEVKKTLRLVVSWSVRFLIVGGLGGGTMEKVYSEAAQKVRAGAIKTAKELAKELSRNVPPDSTFESSFRTARVSQAWLARYYLGAIEKSLQGEKEPELVPNPNSEELNLEHVLPQNPSAAWGLDDETINLYARRLGNLTLLAAGPNSKAGNDTFAEKKRVFKKSKLKLTTPIAAESGWGPTEIDARQATLAKEAKKVWAIKV